MGGEGKCSNQAEELGRQPGRAKGGGRSRRDEEEEGRKSKVELSADLSGRAQEVPP